MKNNIGKLLATLSETEISKVDDLLEKLHANIKPAVKLTKDDVHIRCMYIVSEEINSYGGKFPLTELYKIKDLIVDSPVLVGHKKDQLPIGRNFHAEVIFKDNSHWVKSYFYWMKSADSSEDLQKNIDGGIIKECSIGFTYITPECSICGNDIRTCRHEPFRNYTSNSISKPCYFYYTQIDKVLETSLVYRGAVPNTSISNELQNKKENCSDNFVEEITSSHLLCEQSTYLLTPRYIGLDMFISTTHDNIEFHVLNKMQIPKKIINKFFRKYPKNLQNHFGQLIGYRGKERCSLVELKKYLSGENSIVRRIELRLFPTYEILKSEFQNIKVMRYKVAKKNEIDKLSKSIMTKEGIRLWSLQNLPPYHLGFLYHPLQHNQFVQETSISKYQFVYDKDKQMTFSVIQECRELHFRINRFNLDLFTNGKKFIAYKVDRINSVHQKLTKYNSGKIRLVSQTKDSLQIELDKFKPNKIVIQSILLNGKEQFLISQVN